MYSCLRLYSLRYQKTSHYITNLLSWGFSSTNDPRQGQSFRVWLIVDFKSSFAFILSLLPDQSRPISPGRTRFGCGLVDDSGPMPSEMLFSESSLSSSPRLTAVSFVFGVGCLWIKGSSSTARVTDYVGLSGPRLFCGCTLCTITS